MKQIEVARMIAYVPQNSLRSFRTRSLMWLSWEGALTLGGGRMIGTNRLSGRSSGSSVSRIWRSPLFTELSGGQQQKVLIARALAQATGVILLDEPTSNLDVWHQIDVMEILRSLVRRQDLTAIVAIHDLNMAARYSDTIIMMKGGRSLLRKAGGRPDARESCRCLRDPCPREEL